MQRPFGTEWSDRPGRIAGHNCQREEVGSPQLGPERSTRPLARRDTGNRRQENCPSAMARNAALDAGERVPEK
jgi:hypothetical protein